MEKFLKRYGSDSKDNSYRAMSKKPAYGKPSSKPSFGKEFVVTKADIDYACWRQSEAHEVW